MELPPTHYLRWNRSRQERRLLSSSSIHTQVQSHLLNRAAMTVGGSIMRGAIMIITQVSLAGEAVENTEPFQSIDQIIYGPEHMLHPMHTYYVVEPNKDKACYCRNSRRNSIHSSMIDQVPRVRWTKIHTRLLPSCGRPTRSWGHERGQTGTQGRGSRATKLEPFPAAVQINSSTSFLSLPFLGIRR